MTLSTAKIDNSFMLSDSGRSRIQTSAVTLAVKQIDSRCFWRSMSSPTVWFSMSCYLAFSSRRLSLGYLICWIIASFYMIKAIENLSAFIAQVLWRASCLGSYVSLTIFDLEPLELQIVASPSNQVILAEPSILRLLGYMTFYPWNKGFHFRSMFIARWTN